MTSIVDSLYNGTTYALLHHTGDILRFSDISQVLDFETLDEHGLGDDRQTNKHKALQVNLVEVTKPIQFVEGGSTQ